MFQKSIVSAFAVAAALIASPAFTQQEPIKRIPMQKVEFPANYETNVMMVEVAPGALVARHTHPGIEVSYVMEGESDLTIEGRPPIHLKPGDSFQIPAGAAHSVKNGDKMSRIVGTYVVEKGKPLASAAP